MRVIADSSGLGDNGAMSGGVSWTAGPGASALSFDGASGQVRIPDAPQLEPSTTVSVAAWVARIGRPGAYKYVLANGRDTLRFPRALTPRPGNYVLDLTPSLNGVVGKTIAIPFTVVAARKP